VPFLLENPHPSSTLFLKKKRRKDDTAASRGSTSF